MSDYEFLKYEPVHGQKYLGIATVRCFKKIILKYKIVSNKTGTGSFPCAATYNVGTEQEAKYTPAFMLDSQYEKEELERMIMEHVSAASIKRNMPTSQKYDDAYAKPLVNHNAKHEPEENLPF